MNEIKTSLVDVSCIKPKNGQIFLEYELTEDKTEGGIILPKDVTDKNQKNYVGHIIAIGDSVEGDYEVGQRVIFAKGRQMDLHLKPAAETQGFASHCFVSWYDVVAVVEGDGKIFVN